MAKALMALFEDRHRLELPGGYWLEKQDDNRWQIGCGEMFLAFGIDGNVPVGVGGSMDSEIKKFADAMKKPDVNTSGPICHPDAFWVPELDAMGAWQSSRAVCSVCRQPAQNKPSNG